MDELIKAYVTQNKPHICILTPCSDNKCHISYMDSFIKSQTALQKYDIPITYEFLGNQSDLPHARNNLIAKAMSRANISHFLLVDPDIIWEPQHILLMLLHDKYIVGGIPPISKLQLNKVNPNLLSNCVNNAGEPNEYINYNTLESKILDYDVNLIDSTIDIQNGATKVNNISNSFLLIKRIAIEKMQSAFLRTKYMDESLLENEMLYAYSLFQNGIVDKKYYSDAWLFCERWKNMNGSIWASVMVNIKRVGEHDCAGFYYASIL